MNAIQIKKPMLAHIFVCQGSSCGVDKEGKTAAPGEWLKEEWKRLGLNQFVRLSLAKCLGCCEVANNICLITPEQTRWLAQLNQPEDWARLIDWGKTVAGGGHLLPLPGELLNRGFQRLVPTLNARPSATPS